LHVGAGTFKPVKSDTLEGHDMHAEWIDVEKKVIQALGEAQERTVIAVGTTSMRTVESLYWMGLKALRNPGISLQELELQQWEVYEEQAHAPVKESLYALLKWMEQNGQERLVCRTRILIAPPYSLKIVKGIITNFHQPQSTLLLLISAVVGNDWRKLYDHALANDFRFLSYGDSSLLLK
jgi:S-adenosylmethionine:tRNA ribosyltransferase-isomerase